MRWIPVLVALACGALARPAVAHVGGLGGAVGGGGVPTWLTIATGGAIVGASFLFTSLLTDHQAILAVTSWRASLPAPAAIRRLVLHLLRVVSIVVLVLVVVSGLFGPQAPTANFAILVVWAGWWAGYTISVYTIGNTWPALNPWRAIATVLPRVHRMEYPDRLGSWPSVVGLLALVWIEVVSPVASNPQLLALLVLLYTSVTIAGATVLGVDTWFSRIDPVARVFRCFGRIAPIQRTRNGISLTVPTSALTDWRADEDDPTPFVIALLWVTTYDGLVSTPAWGDLARAIVGFGFSPLLFYFLTLLGGYGLFFGVYRLAARRVRESTETYVTTAFLERYFAPALLPIAAGYHLAHFLGYFLSLLPALVAVLPYPLSIPPSGQVLLLPGWFELLQLGVVLGGHILAVWVAHARSFDLFPGVLTPIRSQYPITVAMIVYTMASMWVVIQPFAEPPFV